MLTVIIKYSQRKRTNKCSKVLKLYEVFQSDALKKRSLQPTTVGAVFRYLSKTEYI